MFVLVDCKEVSLLSCITDLVLCFLLGAYRPGNCLKFLLRALKIIFSLEKEGRLGSSYDKNNMHKSNFIPFNQSTNEANEMSSYKNENNICIHEY